MLAPQLLRTRVARRILVLFLACAVLPVASFAVLAYRATASRLQSDARHGLREGSKTAAMIIMERLHALVSELSGSTKQASFEAIILERADGRLERQRGAFPVLPPLSEGQVAQLAAGEPVVLAGLAHGEPWVFAIRPGDAAHGGYPRRWGMASPKALIGTDPGMSPAPEGTELCLLDAQGNPLDCPSADAARTIRESTEAIDLTWSRDGAPYLLARRALFLGGEFASPSWTVGLSMPQSAVLVPLASFRRTFALGVLLAAVLVFVLSHVQLRKRVSPLAELEAGVRRLSTGDFSTPVVVKTDDEFESLAGSFNAMSTDLRDQFVTLTALQAIDVVALETRSAMAIANAALRWAPTLLEGARAVVAFPSSSDPDSWTVFSAAPNDTRRRVGRVSPSSGELLHLEAALEVVQVEAGSPSHSYFGAEHLSTSVARLIFPLRQNGRIQGALVVAGRDASPFPAPLVARGRQLANQLAVGLSNAWLLDELDALSHGSLLALARTIDANSPWTAGHSERVTSGALEIGRRIGMDHVALDKLRRGGLLHDIGKIGVPTTILDKPGPLTTEERGIVESHPVIGAEIITPIAAFRELIPLVRHHHEKLDGTGYPDGISAEAISLPVRVLTVADIFDALVSDRPYRSGMTPQQALDILRQGAGQQFDERAVQALEQAVGEGWSALAASSKLPLPRGEIALPASGPIVPRIVQEEVFT